MRSHREPADLIGGLPESLAGSGRLRDPRWAEALRAVPRHLFVPRTSWAVPDRPAPGGAAIDRDTDPDGWFAAVYSDTAIATQIEDGARDPATGNGTWTSSCSAPGIVVILLQELAPLDHHRVLEIGTGTGWTAGLLTWRLGPGAVTSVEIDERLAARAAANLREAGLSPALVVGDGADGAPGGAPYDRVHVTCGVERVPAAWLEQCRPGAVLVFPWSPGWGPGHVARLTVAGGSRAVGRLAGPAAFMMLRSQRRAAGPPRSAARHVAASASRTTRLDPRAVAGDAHGAEIAISALVPGVRSHVEGAPDGSCRVWAVDRAGVSWAAADFEPGRDAHAVHQFGPRWLWDEVEAAYLRWVEWGSPARERFGLTTTPDEQHLWLDTPDRPLRDI